MYLLNPRLRGFECLRCRVRHPIGDYPTGCPQCLAAGFPASLRASYASELPIAVRPPGHGLSRFASLLPYLEFPTLGEGDTPLIELPRLANALGLSTLHIKCELQQPTGSHKDRMTCLAIARAVSVGACTVVAASSGNAGVSLAAYASTVGLRCVIVTSRVIDPLWRHAIEMYGGKLLATESAGERWRYMACKVRAEGWFPVTNFIDPPVGSNCWGVDGYKTIAFELFEQAGPSGFDVIVIPSTRGDLLWGIYEGFRCLRASGHIERLPRLVAVEPYPRLAQVLEGADYRRAFPGATTLVSISGTTVAWQAVEAVRSSNGCAVPVLDRDVRLDKKTLASQGIYLELSGAAALTAVRVLRRSGWIHEGAHVAMVGTASAFHEMPDKPWQPIEMVEAPKACRQRSE
jgi:threonine synthase